MTTTTYSLDSPTGEFSIPAHVPAELVVDFDLFNPPNMAGDVQLAWAQLHDGPEIVWTPRNGGHWIATRADDIEVMQLDYEHFSHQNMSLPRSDVDKGTLPLSLDPPEHGPIRKLIMPAFGPKPMRAMGDVARASAIEIIEAILPHGQCEFVSTFGQPLPVNVFLTMVNLPLSDRQRIMPMAEACVRASDQEEKEAAYGMVTSYIAEFVRERGINPGDDIISQITHAEVAGRPISWEESLGISLLLLLGGLDTVASQLGFFAKFLAENPAKRRELIDEPRLIPFAVEELLRRFSIVNTARLITQDYTYNGVAFRAGDMIQLPKSLAGLDDRRYADPAQVDFRRLPSSLKQAAFGAGIHTCPGSVLARRELMIFLEEWLRRIPDFEIDPDKPLVLRSGMVNSIDELHLRW